MKLINKIKHIRIKRLNLRLIISISATFFFVLVFYFIFRNTLLTKTVHNKVESFNKNHKAKISYEKISFKGLATIHFDSLFVTTALDDTLLFIGSLSARIKLGQLIAGHIRFRKVYIEHAGITFKQDKINSYYMAFSRNEGVQQAGSSEINLYARAERLLSKIFTTIPAKLIVKDFSVRYSLDSMNTVNLDAYIGLLSLKKGKLLSLVTFTEDSLTQKAILKGKIKPGQHTMKLSIGPQKEENMLHSPLASLFGATLNYKSLTLNFVEKRNKKNVLKLEGNCLLDRFEVDHKAISSKCIEFQGCSMKFDLLVGTNYIELDSISEITIGKLMLHPYFKYCISPSDTVAFSFDIPTFTVSDFFSSLPADLFPDLKYFEAEGSLSYRAKMVVDLKQPDSLFLESKFNTENFKIKQIDKELSKMNYSFIHTAYEKGRPVRIIKVGPENPDYLSLDQVPVLLQNAILLAEDAVFYSHKGFLLSAIRRAIAENIKERKFARGGSTISQQLIKNVYLSREKTISRKLEEIILVWLIESNRLVSKSRMFEVYINIIEWGPNVYGVNEAARFYFQKDARQLNAEECIFLASVIPRPKKFYYRFDKEGKLAPFMVEYYKDISGKMLKKGLLLSANGDSLSAMLKITGLAKDYLRSDSTLVDSVQCLDMLNEEMTE